MSIFRKSIYVMTCISSFPLFANPLPDLKEQTYSELEKIYMHLHKNPELSFQEEQTSKYIANYLKKLGVEVTEKVGGWGLVGLLRNGTGPTVMLRTDMDALPLKEETGKAYASIVESTDIDGIRKPVMHACGHDIHMTVFMGTAKFLMENKDKWKGTIVLVAQPAEERSGGAKTMLNDGLFEKFPRPDYILALHVSPTLPAGSVGYTSGYAFANVDMVDVVFKGIGGHGAYPHESKDPIVLASQFVLSIQTIVSRETNPTSPSVITVGSIHGGSKHNIIPDEVKLQLTLRSYDEKVRDQSIAALKRMASGLAETHGIPKNLHPTVEVRKESAPAVHNDPELTRISMAVLKNVLGEKKVLAIAPTMAGEDFSFYSRVNPPIPSLMFFLGSIGEEDYQKHQHGAKLASLHSAHFAPVPKPTIKTGIQSLSSITMSLLSTPKS